nr:RidA family protein [Methylopila capsulata]
MPGVRRPKAPFVIRRIGSGPRLSAATVHGGLVYLSGQVPDDLSVDVVDQTRQVLAKIDAILAEAGTDKSRILSVMVWLPAIGDFGAFNTVWDAWVAPGAAPARACVESRLADPAIKVEVGCVAALPAD